MKSLFSSLIILVFFSLNFEAMAQKPDVNSFKDIEGTIKQRINDGVYQVVSVGIIDDNRKRVRTYGTLGTDRQFVSDHIIFEIGSITKLFTATLLAKLVVNGKVNLDDPISKYLPITVDVPTKNGKEITLRHLATHSSGLARLPKNHDISSIKNPYKDYSTFALYKALSNDELQSTPGTKYSYSNFGYELLGAIIQRITDNDYQSLINEEIARPLNMDQIFVRLPDSMKSQKATGTNKVSKKVSDWHFNDGTAGAGGINSTVDGLLTFIGANAGVVESSLDESINRTHDIQFEGKDATSGSETKLGLGWHISERSEEIIYWHNGGTGGFSSFSAFNPEKKIGIVVLTNSRNSVDDIGFKLLDQKTELSTLYNPRGSMGIDAGLIGTDIEDEANFKFELFCIGYLGRYRTFKMRHLIGYNQVNYRGNLNINNSTDESVLRFRTVYLGTQLEFTSLYAGILNEIFNVSGFYGGLGPRFQYLVDSDVVNSSNTQPSAPSFSRFSLQTGGTILGYQWRHINISLNGWTTLIRFGNKKEQDDIFYDQRIAGFSIGYRF